MMRPRLFLLPSFVAALALIVLAGLAFPAPLRAQAGADSSLLPPQKQQETSSQPSSSADLVSAELRLAATPVPAGQSVEAALVLDVQDGWHVNAHRPTFDYLIGTDVQWEPPSDVTVSQTRYPAPKSLRLDFAGEAIDVYEGRAAIFADVRPAPSARPGERRLTGRLRVQACNDRTCLRPSTVTATLAVPVAEANATPTPTGDPVFETSASSPSASSAWSPVWSVLRRHGAFLAGGLLALGTVLFLVLYGQRTGPTEQK